ncbi:MAG: hypothetical protein N2204_09410, partial [Anaerolineae bacterium]|nr:hypothetical protein [Anaerolineae bacterium]
ARRQRQMCIRDSGYTGRYGDTMTATRDAIIQRMNGQPTDGTPLFLPDLTLWHKWHSERGTLPSEVGTTLADAARALAAPVWSVVRPWEAITPGIETQIEQVADQRVVRHLTPAGVLTARWQLGPDGDWWQMEYPVKTADDLPAALAWVKARCYRLKPNIAQRTAGDDTVQALELPMQPFSDLLHTLLGWGEGLMVLASHRDVIQEMITALKNALDGLLNEVAGLPGDVLLAPDNLDGQYISPRYFREYMAAGYRHTADIARAAGKPLVVHAGGPVRRLLPLLAEAGGSSVEGGAGPPQSDATLAEARALVGPNLTLWGGIPQDFLLADRTWEEFEDAVREAAHHATGDDRIILGVADRVPVDAQWGRLKAIRDLLR